MNRFRKSRVFQAGVGLLILSVVFILVWRFMRKPTIHAQLKYSYTILVEDMLLQEGDWPGLWEPLQAQFPGVEFVIRPLIAGSEEKPLPPFDLLIAHKAIMDRAQAVKALESPATPFLETGYQLIYYRLADRTSIPENWMLLNLEAQNYLDTEHEKFLLAAPDQAQTFLPLLIARSSSASDVFDLMRDMRLSYRSVPLGCYVGCALRLFEESKSPLLWHTDLYLGELYQRFGDKLGLGPLPKLNGHVLRTPRQTIYVAEASHPLPTSQAVTQELLASWQGAPGALLIFKSLHRFASAYLQVQESSGDPVLDQLKNIVQNFTIAMDEQTKAKAEAHLRPIVDEFLAADISAGDAARRSEPTPK